MKIISLSASNVKKLSAVEIVPKSNLVQITGKNGQGKSSILDSIWWALGGTKNIQSQPVRNGEEQAIIRLDLGSLVVTRKIGKGESLTVENAEGARFQSPQSMLDALLGELTFDPLAFSKMKAADQANELRRIAKLGNEIDELDKANADDFARRTEFNRAAKSARASAESIVVPDGLPEQRIDVAALIDELQRAGETNATIQRRTELREEAAKKIVADRARADELAASADAKVQAVADHWNSQIQATKLEIRRLQDLLIDQEQAKTEDVEGQRKAIADEIAAILQSANNVQMQLDAAPPLPLIVDVADLRRQIADAEVTNKALDAKAQRATFEAKANEAEMTSKALTEAMEARAKKRLEIIQAAKMPIPGLSLGDGVVLFNDIPLDQASSAEQLRVSVAIAMAANPKLRVLRIKEGSLLDDDGLDLLASMAAENDFQIWMEKVDSSGKVGIVIENGAVVSDNQVAPAATAAE